MQSGGSGMVRAESSVLGRTKRSAPPTRCGVRAHPRSLSKLAGSLEVPYL